MTKNNWREEFRTKIFPVFKAMDYTGKTIADTKLEQERFAEAARIEEFIKQVEANAKREAYEKGKKDAKEIAIELINGNYKGSFIDDADYICWYADDLIDLITDYLTPPIDEQE